MNVSNICLPALLAVRLSEVGLLDLRGASDVSQIVKGRSAGSEIVRGRSVVNKKAFAL